MLNLKKLVMAVFLMAALMCVAGLSLAAPPIVSNLQVSQVQGSYDVQIDFDLHDADGDLAFMTVMFTTDGGITWDHRCRTITGDVSYVESGTGKQIIWDALSEYPDFQGDTCRIQLFASDIPTQPRVDLYKVIDGQEYFMAVGDTVGYGHPLTVRWHGMAPIVEGFPPELIAERDTIFPYDDGLLGFKWLLPYQDCVPTLEDCWQPRYYNEATGDSISFWGPYNQVTFNTPGHVQLPEGDFPLRVNTIDIVQNEIPEYAQEVGFVHNFDPETIMLNGETDWAHPADTQVYPYYTMLDDPTQTRYPFVDGDRIPDRTYVVVKALFRDDPRDMIVDPDFSLGSVGNVLGTRFNYTGGQFSFQTGASGVDYEPDWEPGIDGWAADTLGFMTGPRTEFTFTMQGVDEHGRRDGTPAALTFEVGYPPCVQCVEILPGTDTPSNFTPDLDCYDGGVDHACFTGEETPFYIAGSGVAPDPGREYLEQAGSTYMAISKQTLLVSYQDTAPDPAQYYSIPCNVYPISILLHGMDDPREAWQDPLLRAMAWRYQVDYECDPYNSIQDGGGLDDLSRVTWGHEMGAEGIEVHPQDGVWRLTTEVIVPQLLVQVGSATYLQIIQFTMADGDPVLAQELFDLSIRQLGPGSVRASVLDQTRCGYIPMRPARYHLFHGIRPVDYSLPGGQTWRDCYPSFGGVTYSLDLHHAAMESHASGAEVQQHFHLILEESGGDLTCDTGSIMETTPQLPWYEVER